MFSESIKEIEKEFEIVELHMTIVCVSDSEYVNESVLVKIAPLQSDSMNVFDSVNVLDFENVLDSVNVLDCMNVSIGGKHFSIVVPLATLSGSKLVLLYEHDSCRLDIH